MREYIYNHVKLEHLLCVLILFSRIGDIGTTYLATPTLKLEANPIVRRLGWWFAIATLLLCLIPYYSTALGIIILIPSLMISASNANGIWFARVYGEKETQEMLLHLAKKSCLSHALTPTLVASVFIALVGLTMLLLSQDPGKDWCFWFGLGFLAYALAIGFHRCVFYARLFRKARRDEPKSPLA